MGKKHKAAENVKSNSLFRFKNKIKFILGITIAIIILAWHATKKLT